MIQHFSGSLEVKVTNTTEVLPPNSKYSRHTRCSHIRTGLGIRNLTGLTSPTLSVLPLCPHTHLALGQSAELSVGLLLSIKSD